MPFSPIDISNKKYNKLTAVRFIRRISAKNRVYIWLFRCECGKEIELRKKDVLDGNTKSCGCSFSEFIRQTRIKNKTSAKIRLRNGYLNFSRSSGTQRVHRQIMEKELAKYPNAEKLHVHHINKIKTDNRKENLMIVDPRTHARLDRGMCELYKSKEEALTV